MIESWEHGYETIVGERGIRLSGGQRQRIGIARALYKQAEVIVLDEATSALDEESQESIIKTISGLKVDKTIIMITHRLKTVQSCDKVFSLSNGVLAEKDICDMR